MAYDYPAQGDYAVCDRVSKFRQVLNLAEEIFCFHENKIIFNKKVCDLTAKSG